MGTKNNPGSYDCYSNAEPDEPLFVLLGRDKHAPTLVWLWAVLREIDGEDPAVVDEARKCALSMITHLHRKGRRACGLGTAGLAAQMELIRQANAGLERSAENAPTDEELVRGILARTLISERAEVAGD